MAYIHLVFYSGKIIKTTVTDEASVVDDWVRDIRLMYSGQNIVVGLDCEWKLHPVRSMSNKTATLQLCIDTKCLILQLFYMDSIPESIKSFLSDPNITFVGVEVEEDVSKLRNEYELCCINTADIRELAKRRFPFRFDGKPGLKALANQLVELYMRKPKRVCQRNWESRVLDKEQIEYASIDAYASYMIGHKLLKEM